MPLWWQLSAFRFQPIQKFSSYTLYSGGTIMRMYDIILKKREGGELSTEEINYFVREYTKGSIPDYQASALLMAIFLKKMSRRETLDLTKAMMNSGDVLDLSQIEGLVVDKHSTGGVGDKTTLILAPLIASCGVPMAKMAGRGLVHTGGTIDKLESIDGFNTQMSEEDFIQQVNDIGVAISGQTGDLAPADKKIYALRDVTATVDNLSLIASSVMSKKLASGAQGIVLDVKMGNGAFMKTQEEAVELAKIMIDIGIDMGKGIVAVISDMEQPLGRAVGNAIEIKEAIEVLQGKGPEDLVELCFVLGTELLLLSGLKATPEEVRNLIDERIKNGEAFNKFVELIKVQGGDEKQLLDPESLASGKYEMKLLSDKSQYISHIEAEKVGSCALLLGAGRENKESKIDLGVGIYLNKKVGEKVEKGQVIATIYANDEEKGKEALEKLRTSYHYSDTPVEKRKLIYGIYNKDGVKLKV